MSVPRILVPLAPGFEEIEAVTIIDVLRRAECLVVTAGVHERSVLGSHGITLVADRSWAEIQSEDFDAIVLPGGMPGARHLAEDPDVLRVLKVMAAAGRVTAAICAAPIALSAAGITLGRRVTSYPGFASRIRAQAHSDESVVCDGPVITSRGVGTALAFALALVSRFRGPVVAAELAAKMLVDPPTHPFPGPS